jgi:hypothetical protein
LAAILHMTPTLHLNVACAAGVADPNPLTQNAAPKGGAF